MAHHSIVPVDVLLFHDPPRGADPPLTRLLADVRTRLVQHQSELFRRAGASRVLVVPGRASSAPTDTASSFGEHLRDLVIDERIERLIVLGSGAVPRLGLRDARTLVDAAQAPGRRALTNNRYSSDVCAISDTAPLHELPPLPSDNALPRWLEELAGFAVTELPGRDRLALDLDSPLDVGLWALASDAPAWARSLASEHALHVPRADELHALARDPRRELLVFGRSGSRTMHWLERNVRCRVRFLAEERGLRASSPLAIGDGPSAWGEPRRPPRATLGRLIEERGHASLESIVAELADGAILDTRVLMADRLGADEDAWPRPEDRFASDLLRADIVDDPWLQAITDAAAEARIPIALGAHTLVGPGIPLLLRGARRAGPHAH